MSTAPKHSWFRSGLHFCGSCLVTVSCWALWLVLGALLAVLLYVAFAKELPVPGHVLRRIEGEMARSGLILSFGRARFDPTGKVLLQDVRLRTAQFEDPLLTCRLLYVRHSFWALLAGQTAPAEIQIEGADLQLPAMLAPSGTTEPVVRDLAATFRRHDHVWEISQFAGRMGPLALTVHGEITPRRGPAPAPALDRLTARFLEVARRLAPLMDRLEAFETPALAVRLDTDLNGSNRATLLLTAAGARRPWNHPVEIGPFAAGATLAIGRGAAQQVQVQFAARRLDGPQEITAGAVRALLKVAFDPAAFTLKPLELLAAAGAIETPHGTASGPGVGIDLSGWPEVRADLAAQVDGEFLAAQVEAGLQEKSARVHATGRITPDFINRTLSRQTPRAAPFFRFGDPVSFEAEATLAAGWQFDRLGAWVDAGRLDSRGVAITAARGRIDIVGKNFLARDARVALDGSQARGSYWMDLGTTDYRMLLEGRLHPLDINGWFRSDWWANFWNRYFSFPGGSPSAEVDIQGRWKNPLLSHNFVHAHARDATIWGGDFESVDATVFVRPAFAHGLALTGSRAGGAQRLTGSFKRFGVPGRKETSRFEFDFDTDADPVVLGRMLEGRADEVLASLRFTQSPRIHAWGALDGGHGDTLTPDYRFTAHSTAPLHYYGFPLEAAHVTGRVAGQEVRLDDIQFGAAGGAGGGRAFLTGAAGQRRLEFDLLLNKARLGDSVHAVQEYLAARTGEPLSTSPDSKFVRTAANSLLDVALNARGDPASLASFKGSGQASLSGGQLGEVHLFGLLSQVLSGLSLSFSSLKFDTAHTRFQLDRGELLFPDLKVTGPSASIDATGRYAFESNALDFTAKFKPFDQPGSLLAAAVSIVINPLTSILELKLSGPLGDPKWSVEVKPGSRPAAPAPPPSDTPENDSR